MNTSEILLTIESYEHEDWRRFVLTTAKQIGGLNPFTLVISTADNKLRFFIANMKFTEEYNKVRDLVIRWILS